MPQTYNVTNPLFRTLMARQTGQGSPGPYRQAPVPTHKMSPVPFSPPSHDTYGDPSVSGTPDPWTHNPAPSPMGPPPTNSGAPHLPNQEQRWENGQQIQNAYANRWSPNPVLLQTLMNR